MRSHVLLPAFTRRSLLRGLGAAAALPILAACQSQVEVTRVVEKPVDCRITVTISPQQDSALLIPQLTANKTRRRPRCILRQDRENGGGLSRALRHLAKLIE